MKKTALLIAIIAVALTLLMWNFTPRAGASANTNNRSQKYGVRSADTARDASSDVSRSEAAARQQDDRLVDLSKPTRVGEDEGEEGEGAEASDADMPSKPWRGHLSESEYLRMRDEYVGLLRGISPGAAFDPRQRTRAIDQMQTQEMEIIKKARAEGVSPNVITPAWSEIGPTTVPIANGQYQGGLTGTITGRTTAVVVDPTNSNKVYLGTAQGGVFRSLDGGATWTQIFDSAQSLAIGAIALAPSNPTILYVGTGEGNNSGDSFFGVGVYRIDNVDTAPSLVGPINPSFSFTSSASGNPTITTTVFGGRSISKILVHPTDPATIFVSTAAGVSGISGLALGNLVGPLGLRGVYRSTNATSPAASVTFQKLTVNADNSLDTPGTGNTSISDMVFDPTTPNNLLVAASGAVTGGGVWRSTNAQAATPTFTNVLFPGFNGLWIRLAIATDLTTYASTNEPSTNATCSGAGQAGRLRKSIDGGVTWPTTAVAAGTGGISAAAEGYCGGQCVYDNPVGVDPTNSSIVYLAGNARGTCSDVMKRSADGAVTFTRDDTDLHADSHSIFIDTLPATHSIWFANDGGIYNRPDAAAGTAWTSKNNTGLGSLQFMSVAVHPTDRNFTLGGTQDNGTEDQQTTPGNWSSAEGGDGGYALIDRSSTNTTTNINMYHTFFNQRNNQILFDRAELGSCLAVKDGWETRGNCNGCPASDPTPSCDGTAFFLQNGIQLTDNVNFYAPMALGPGNPNTVYFGTDRLYRSTDRGDTMSIVSQSPIAQTSAGPPPIGTPISAIGISPFSDNLRVVGLNSGAVWATINGSSTLTNILTPATLPNNPNASTTTTKFISRIGLDPNNGNTAYITLSYYTPAGQGIWKTTNLDQTGIGSVTWAASANGIPSVPINAFAIDQNSGILFAGTDIGVYASFDNGANWSPYGTGLPRVAVFDMAIQPTTHTLRIATHGRGMWEIAVIGPTAAQTAVSGQVTTPDGTPLGGVAVNLSGASDAMTVTDSQGHYLFDNLTAGGFYSVTPQLVNYSFSPSNRTFTLNGSRTDATFVAEPNLVVTANPIDTAEFFVRQQYLDFLGREPDTSGLAYWSEQIRNCGSDIECIRQERISVAAAFFIENEFSQTGSYVYRLYKASYGQRPKYAQFIADRVKVIGGPYLEASKNQLAEDWVSRAEFKQAYPDSMSNSEFVNKLMDTAGFAADALERQQRIASMNEGKTRAEVLRDILEIQSFRDREYNPSFILMQYFGYLHRDPDTGGYNFWLDVLNNRVPGNYRSMVCAFLTSTEYQRRFGSVVTRSNSECGQ